MNIKDLNPYVRFCAPVRLATPYPQLLNAYDHRLFFVLSGGFTAELCDGHITVKKGDILLLPPATPYKLIPFEQEKSKHIIINFDLVSDNYGTPTKPLSPIGEFNKEEAYSLETMSWLDSAVHLENAFSLGEQIKEMCMIIEKKQEGYIEELSAKMKLLTVHIKRALDDQRIPDSACALSRNVLAYIDEHFCENITNQSIASYFGYHPYYLNSLFHKTTGATIHGIILKKRMNKASLLLLTSNLPIAEISSACGFSSPSYFTEVFSGYYGVTPHIYKESAH